MILQRVTWPVVEKYLREHRGVLIPVGSTEQHGPAGMLGTDAICPETIAHSFADADDLMVAPTLSIGMAQHHLAFPGSIALRRFLRLRRGLCPKCAYPIGESTVCTECGHRLSSHSVTS